jgi:hypothetical protein
LEEKKETLKDFGRQGDETEDARKIQKDLEVETQSPTAVFWSLGCPVMPTRRPSDKLRPEPHPCQLAVLSATEGHTCSILLSPHRALAQGPLAGWYQRCKRMTLGQVHTATIPGFYQACLIPEPKPYITARERMLLSQPCTCPAPYSPCRPQPIALGGKLRWLFFFFDNKKPKKKKKKKKIHQ